MNRFTDDDYDKNKKDSITNESDQTISKYVGKPQLSSDDYYEIKNNTKYKEIFEKLKTRKDYIDKRAKKFKNLIFTKYGDLSFKELLKKAKKYAKKYRIDEEEFKGYRSCT